MIIIKSHHSLALKPALYHLSHMYNYYVLQFTFDSSSTSSSSSSTSSICTGGLWPLFPTLSSNNLQVAQIPQDLQWLFPKGAEHSDPRCQQLTSLHSTSFLVTYDLILTGAHTEILTKPFFILYTSVLCTLLSYNNN